MKYRAAGDTLYGASGLWDAYADQMAGDRQEDFPDNTDRGGRSSRLKITAEEEKTSHFSCLPYTAQELEKCNAPRGTPPARRTVVSILEQ